MRGMVRKVGGTGLHASIISLPYLFLLYMWSRIMGKLQMMGLGFLFDPFSSPPL